MLTKWTEYGIKRWCINFVAKNGRLPESKDFSFSDYSDTPNLMHILKKYKSIKNLYHNAGGTRSGKKIYTLEEIKNGFEKYFAEHGYYPSATEIDLCSYLPSSRTIQRSWGGLSNLRKVLKYQETDYRKGSRRSNTAIKVNQLAFETENKLEKYLIEIFGDVFVHSQKRIGHTHVDFFIFTPDKNICIDVFTYIDLFSYSKNINNKMHTYKNFPHEIIFVPIGELLTQKEAEARLLRKKNKLSSNMKVMLVDELKLYLAKFPKYALPIRNG